MSPYLGIRHAASRTTSPMMVQIQMIQYQFEPGWWFQTFFMFIPIWGNDFIWLIFFRWVETTNQELLPQIAHNILSMAFMELQLNGAMVLHDSITVSSLTDVRSPLELQPIHSISPFQELCNLNSHFFGHTWSKTRRMACLTSQQSRVKQIWYCIEPLTFESGRTCLEKRTTSQGGHSLSFSFQAAG